MKLNTEDKVLKILSPTIFGGPEALMNFLSFKGNPKYHIMEDYYISPRVTTLGSLVGVTGGLFIDESKLSDFGILKTISGNLYLKNTPLLEKFTLEEIRNMVDIGGEIYIIE